MISLDSAEKNAEFARSLDAKHVLLSDLTGETAKAYGVTGVGGFFAKRWTFYIDAAGKIVAIDRDVKPESAGQDIARKLAELGYPRR